VLVVPRDDQQRWNRGRAFGEWLNHGSPSQLAPLARVEVVCAKVAELEHFRPPGDGDPLMVLIAAAGDAPGTVLDGALPAYDNPRIHRDGESLLPDDEVFRLRVELLSKLTHAALPPVAPGEIATLATEVDRRLVRRPPAGSHWANSSGCGTKVEPTPEELEAERRADEEALKKGVIRGKTFVAIGCGMGHVPEKSRRFLDFYARGPGLT
jgi:hypothetical protein